MTPSASAAPAAASVVSPPNAAYNAAGDGSILKVTAVPIASPASCDPESPTFQICQALNTLLNQLIDGLKLPATSVANLNLTHVAANADSTASPRTTAHAANLDPLTALSVDLSALLSEVNQSAPPDNAAPATDSLLDIPAAQTGGLLAAGVADASALAHWAGDNACVSSTEPLSAADNSVASVEVLPAAGLGGVAFAGPNGGAVGVHSFTALPTTNAFAGNDPRAVYAETNTQVAEVDLFNDALKIQVVTPPTVTATATGIPGTASATFTQPVLRINGNDVVSGQDLSDLLTPILGPLQTALQPLGPVLSFSLTVGTGTTNVSPDGTSASASGSLLTLHLALTGVTILDLNILPITANATAPAGGLDCGQRNPVTVTKASDHDTVQPGDSFVYTITVANTATDCTLTNVHANDVLTGPDGSTITATDPQASSADWPNVVWNVGTLPDIPPGGHIDLHVTVQVPVNATPGDTYTDTATGFGTCNGTEYSAPFTLNGPPVGVGVLPRTGGDSAWPLIGAALLLAGAFGLRRLRRA